MHSPPPSYDEAIRFAEHLKNNPSQVAKMYEAMAKEARSDQTRAKLKDEIDKLAGAVEEISKSFDNVSLSLARVDKNDYKEADGITPVPKLKPGWDELRDRWDQVYLRSRKSASDTAFYADKMLQLIIPMLGKSEEEVSLEDKLEVLNSFITREKPSTVNSIEDATNIANNHSEEFKALATDVRKYKLKFDNFAEAQKIVLQKDVDDLKKALEKLDSDLEEQEKAIRDTGIKIGLIIFGTAANALAALATLGPAGPATALGILIPGLLAAGAEAAELIKQINTYNSTSDKRDTTKTKLDKATADLQELVHLRALLESAKLEIGVIAARLDQFSNVWGMIAQDASIIANDLRAAQQVPTSDEFEQKLELIQASYTALLEALEHYKKATKPQGDEPEPEPGSILTT